MNKFANKVALITGAGSGLGAATARLLAREGAKVALLSLIDSEVEQVAADIAEEGGEALRVQGDVSKVDEVNRAVDELRETWGRLDIVFANAGVNGVWAPLEELTLEEWNQTIANNLTGAFLTVQKSLPLLKERGGSVIITSSVNGTRTFSNTGATAYACSKAALVAFAKMIAVELAAFHIRVNVICPGYFDTHIHSHCEKRHLEKVKVAPDLTQRSISPALKVPGHPDQVRQPCFVPRIRRIKPYHRHGASDRRCAVAGLEPTPALFSRSPAFLRFAVSQHG